jgi:hypothetical protein
MIEGEYSLKEVDSEEFRELLAESEPIIEEPESLASEICARIQALRDQNLRQALPILMLELEQIARENLEVDDRIAVMRCVKKPVLKALAGLPDPRRPGGGASGSSAGLTMAQRLMTLMIYNLRKTLHDVDRTHRGRFTDDDNDRIWVLHQLFRFFSRQIRYGIDYDRPWPQNTWRDLHDLFVYLVVRGMVQLNTDFGISIFEEGFDAEIEYKRALLLGLVDRLTDHHASTGDFFGKLKTWASDTRLQDPKNLVGTPGLIKVQVTRDEPPECYEEALAESFRGWVLRPPQGFYDYINTVKQNGH